MISSIFEGTARLSEQKIIDYYQPPKKEELKEEELKKIEEE